MDLSPTNWLSEMEMDDIDFDIHQWQQMSSLDCSVDSFTNNVFPSNNMYPNPISTSNSAPQVSQISFEKQIKQVEQKQWKPCISDQKASSSSSSSIISFANPDSPRASVQNNYGNANLYVNPEVEPVEIMSLENLKNPLEFGEGLRKGATRNTVQAQDHVLSERKRRERMTQRFIALSAVIPGLKKLDKATVLGDAINYIKELQERARKLEEELKRNNEESVVSVKRPRELSAYDDGSSCTENFDGSSDQSLLEIEVRASEGKVLVRVYCKNQTGIIKQIFSEIERHDHLSLVSSNVMPFGEDKLHITIIAQMSDQYKMTAKNLEDNLRTAVVNLIEINGQISLPA